VTIYTIGFTRTSAESFFARLRAAGVGRVLDVRLNNTSQLAGFAKAVDLEYFLGAILGAGYAHEPLLAPTPELLAEGRDAKTGQAWRGFEVRFRKLMQDRAVHEALDRRSFETPTALLCSEATAERCHRRLVGEHLAEHWPDISIVDL
jgi:uncharacterized protein (DUF488 family)